MRRTLFSILVLGLFAFAFAQYNEAPMLAERVAAGELPTVEDRLPTNPMVVEPVDQIGRYGGTLRRACTGPADGQCWLTISRASLIEWAPGAAEPLPALAESWDVSEDGSTYTFHLREGLKWSDGQPHTADDWLFYYEAILQNDELSPSFPTWLVVAGEPVVISKIDDTTVEFKFAGPYSLLPSLLAFRGRDIFTPAHYLSQFHPDYADADELQALVEEGGFENWVQLFQSKWVNGEFLNPDLPVMRAWKVTQAFPADRMIAERNPYYWKVDGEGNQLPYIDFIHADLLSDAQVITLRAASGGIDFQYRHMAFSNAALLIDGQEEGNYRVLRWTPGGGWFALYMNQSHKDPAIRELMQNPDFRQAMSVAIDRDEMNQLLYNGIGTPEQVTASVLDPYHIPGAGQRWLEYDPDLANELLDGIGLDQRDPAGFRLRPDGERLRLSILTYPFETGASSGDAYELVVKYWQAVGVDASMDLVERSLWTTRITAGDSDVGGYTSAGTLWEIDPLWFALTANTSYMAPLYGLWYQTGGAEGEEPPPQLRRLQQAYDELKVTIDPDARLALGQEIIRAHDENNWIIGTVKLPFQPVVVSNDLVNVVVDGVASYRLLHEGQTWFEQLAFINPEDH